MIISIQLFLNIQTLLVIFHRFWDVFHACIYITNIN